MNLWAKIAMFVAIVIIGAISAALAWNYSDPDDCAVGQDPGIALADERAGAPGTYSEWCHEFDGNALHVVEAGEGEVVLFIHGFPTYWYSLQRLMEPLRDEYRVVAIDGLGAGYSDAPTDVERYRLDAMARHLDALIDELGADQVHLVGHDWGAAFGLAYAQSRPERIKSVVGMSAPPQNIAVEMLLTSESQREKSEYVEQLKSASPILAYLTGAGDRIAGYPRSHAAAGRLSDAEAEAIVEATQDLRRVNRHINWYRANLPAPGTVEEADFWPSRSARLEMPALLIWGEDDTVFDPAFIDLMEAWDADLTVLRLEGVGHAPQFEATEAVNEAIQEHFSQQIADLEFYQGTTPQVAIDR